MREGVIAKVKGNSKLSRCWTQEDRKEDSQEGKRQGVGS